MLGDPPPPEPPLPPFLLPPTCWESASTLAVAQRTTSQSWVSVATLRNGGAWGAEHLFEFEFVYDINVRKVCGCTYLSVSQ